MSAFTFAFNNLITSTSCSTPSADSFFPFANIFKTSTIKEYRAPLGTTSVILTVDLLSATAVDSFFIAGNNATRTLQTTTVTLKANTSNSFASPAFTTTVTCNAAEAFGWLKFATQTYRYWQITVATSGSQVGFANIFLGRSVQLPNNDVGPGWTFRREDRSTFVEGRYGQKYWDVLNTRKHISGQFDLLDITERDAIVAMFDAVTTYRGIWVGYTAPNESASAYNRVAGYFYADDTPEINTSSYGLHSLPFSLTEVV